MSCGEPSTVANANFTSGDNLYEDTAKYTCDIGHEVTSGIDNWTITCQSNATWTSGETCSSMNNFNDFTNKLMHFNFGLKLYTNDNNGTNFIVLS